MGEQNWNGALFSIVDVYDFALSTQSRAGRNTWLQSKSQNCLANAAEVLIYRT